MADMPGMATEGRRAEGMSGGQGAEGHAIDEGAADLLMRGVITDGTAGRLMAWQRRATRRKGGRGGYSSR